MFNLVRGGDSPTERLLYSKVEAAKLLSISVRSLEYLIAAGMIRVVRKGRRVLLPRSEILRLGHLDHPFPFHSARKRRIHAVRANLQISARGGGYENSQAQE